MHHRNVLSLVKSFAAATLVSLAGASATLAHADSNGQSFQLLSMLPPSVVVPTALVDSPLVVHELHAAPPVSGTIDLTEQHGSLWVRLRNGFAMTNLNDDLTLHYQQWYQNRPDALRRMVERSRPYLHHIVEELEARGMPTEIALLPMVESSFNPMAYSRAHASGLWQFIPATGKRFNLEQNWWHDQRRDIVASTSAALEYLQTIYDMHGDWHLALASYNWGEGSVKRAIEKNTARGLPTDYASLTMPNETRHYVPKLQALKNIFGNPALMAQLGLPEITNQPFFATIETSRPMDVKTAARLANMRIEEFQALNPAHNRPVMKADTPVVIPADKVATFQNNLDNHDASLSEWQAYTLKPGEKLDQVAPRFGITLADLMRANGLQGKIKLGSGTTLLVPGGNGSDNLSSLGAEPRLPQIVEAEPVSKPVAAQAPVGRSGKAGKVVAGTTSGANRVRMQIPAKAAGKEATKVTVATKSASNTAKIASSKPAAPAQAAKVAKAQNGRRS